MELRKGYKQTEVGIIPLDWNVVQVGETLKIRHGKDQKLVQDNNGIYPILGTGGLMGYSNEFLYDKESVLIGRKGTIDKPKFIDSPFWTVDTLFYSEVFPSYSPKFIYYNFLLINWYSYNEASGVPSLNAKSIESIFIPIPPTKPEQTAIANALSDADAYISSLEKLIEKKRLIKHGAMQQLLKPKKGWVTKKLIEICWFQEGPGLRNWQFTNSGIKVINVTNLENGYLNLERTDRHISLFEFEKMYKHFEIDEDDIVVASSGNSYGKVSVVRKRDLPLLMNTSVIRFKPKKELDYSYLLIFLKSKDFKSQIDLLITGGAQPNFGPFHLNKISLTLPDTLAEQKQISDTILDIEFEIESLENKLLKAKQIKQGMMHELLTGKIRLV